MNFSNVLSGAVLPTLSAGSIANAFLKNANSTVTLNYGSSYDISSLRFGQHLGAGTISLRRDANLFIGNVTCPAASPNGVQFANFALAGGDSVTTATIDLSADRI